ncbi:MAG: MFS transporter [Polyangiaceae bacterium]|jgi:PPP family 3-phenylpropionic acid transporter|nr:MFS transporter [Polyangiaceae bacterium]
MVEPFAIRPPLAMRSFYFFSYGALGALFPFLPLLLASRGLSPSAIAWVMVVVPLTNIVIPPLWGSAADALRARVPLLRAASVGSALGVVLLLPSWDLVGSIAVVAVFSVFRAPLSSLADAAAVDALGGRNASFSHIRLWGSIGFAAFAACLGWLDASAHPRLLLLTASGAYLLAAALTLTLRSPPLLLHRGLTAEVVTVLRRAHVLLFLLGNAVYYAGHAAYDSFFSLHARRLGFADRFVGTAWAVGVGAEIGVLFIAPRLLRGFRSSALLAVCAFVAVLRWLGLSEAVSAPAILGLQSLHGITFGLWYVAMVNFIQTRAPDHLRTSLQSVALSATGLGTVAGYLGAGYLFDALGSQSLFRMAAVSAVGAVLCYAGAYAAVLWYQQHAHS